MCSCLMLLLKTIFSWRGSFRFGSRARGPVQQSPLNLLQVFQRLLKCTLFSNFAINGTCSPSYCSWSKVFPTPAQFRLLEWRWIWYYILGDRIFSPILLVGCELVASQPTRSMLCIHIYLNLYKSQFCFAWLMRVCSSVCASAGIVSATKILPNNVNKIWCMGKPFMRTAILPLIHVIN